MKDIYKNPTLYYILAPIVVVLWSLVVWGFYLPEAEHKWQAEKSQYNKAQAIMVDILALDPDRIEFADSKTTAAEFDYANAVERAGLQCVKVKLTKKKGLPDAWDINLEFKYYY